MYYRFVGTDRHHFYNILRRVIANRHIFRPYLGYTGSSWPAVHRPYCEKLLFILSLTIEPKGLYFL